MLFRSFGGGWRSPPPTLLGGDFESTSKSSLGRRPRGWGSPPTSPFHLYNEGQGSRERHTFGVPSRLTASSLLPPNPSARAPGDAMQELHLHIHHHTVVLLDVGRRSTSPPPLLAGTRRGRTTSTPNVRPRTEVLPERCTDSIDYINNELTLVGFWNSSRVRLWIIS